MAHQIFSRFIDPSNETEETVTLSAETVAQISKRLASKEYDRIYRGEWEGSVLLRGADQPQIWRRKCWC